MKAVKTIVSLIVVISMLQPVWGGQSTNITSVSDEPAYDSGWMRLIAFGLGLPLMMGSFAMMIGIKTPLLPRACVFSLCGCCVCLPFCCIPGAIVGLIRGIASALGDAYTKALPGMYAGILGGLGPWSLCPDVGVGVAITPALMMCCPLLFSPCGHLAEALCAPCTIVCPLSYCLSACCLFNVITQGSAVGIATLGSLMPHTFSKPDLPLPTELSDYYWAVRAKNLLAWGLYLMMPLPSVDHREAFVPAGEMAILRDIIKHDAGEMGTKTSDIAAQYLRETVIDPIKETRSVELQTGQWVSFEGQPTDLETAKLLYYYVRDSILYPHLNETTSLERYVQQFPWGAPLAKYYKWQRSNPRASRFSEILRVFPYMTRYPTEAAATREGTCAGKSFLLAALLKMEGFDVALGTYPMNVLITQTDPSLLLHLPGSYHVYVLLRDPGWGIGHWEIEQDDWGQPMGGKWIILDPTRSPRHLPEINMPGEKVLEFGDDPAWFALMDRDIKIPSKPVFITLV